VADTLMVAIMVAFIALCVAYTRWCDSIIGHDEPQPPASADSKKVA